MIHQFEMVLVCNVFMKCVLDMLLLLIQKWILPLITMATIKLCILQDW
jgi:hypothetical protein